MQDGKCTVLCMHSHSLEGCQLVLMAEVLNILLVQGVGAGNIFVIMETSDIAVAVKLQLEKFCKREEEGLVGHPCVGSALYVKVT